MRVVASLRLPINVDRLDLITTLLRGEYGQDLRLVDDGEMLVFWSEGDDSAEDQRGTHPPS